MKLTRGSHRDGASNGRFWDIAVIPYGCGKRRLSPNCGHPDLRTCWLDNDRQKSQEGNKNAVYGLTIRILRFVSLFLLIPVIFLMNACSLVLTERSNSVSSGILTAEIRLLNAGAMADYSGNVLVLPRYFPHIWPFDLVVGCRALTFESDPRIDLTWTQSALVIEHDPFARPPTKLDRCYGRTITLRERML